MLIIRDGCWKSLEPLIKLKFLFAVACPLSRCVFSCLRCVCGFRLALCSIVSCSLVVITCSVCVLCLQTQLTTLRRKQEDEFGHIARAIFELATDDADDWVRVIARLLIAMADATTSEQGEPLLAFETEASRSFHW